MHILGLALFLLIALPWPIAVLRTLPHAREIWRYESVGEFADNVHNARPWWFYLGALPQVLAPWIAFVIVGMLLVVGRKDARHRRHWFAPIWIALTVLVFSFANLKKAAYLLPMMPGVALLTSEGIAAVAAHLRRRRTSHAPPLVILRLSGAIILACGGIAIAWLAVKALRQTGAIAPGPIAVALAALAVGMIACLRVSLLNRRWFQVQAAIAGCLMLLLVLASSTYAAKPRTPIVFDRDADAELMRTMDSER